MTTSELLESMGVDPARLQGGSLAVQSPIDGAVVARLREHTADETAQAIGRSEEHTSELQSLMRISYAVFCLKKKKKDISSSGVITKHRDEHIKTEQSMCSTRRNISSKNDK